MSQRGLRLQANDGEMGGAKAILQEELKAAKSALAAAEGKLVDVESQLKGVLKRALTAADSANQAEADIQVYLSGLAGIANCSGFFRIILSY